VGMIQRCRAVREVSDYELMNTSVEQTGFPIQVAIWQGLAFIHVPAELC
jgi:hypothetical protein